MARRLGRMAPIRPLRQVNNLRFLTFEGTQPAGYFFASVEEKADGRRRSCRLPRLLSICAKDGPVRDGDDTRKEGRE